VVPVGAGPAPNDADEDEDEDEEEDAMRNRRAIVGLGLLTLGAGLGAQSGGYPHANFIQPEGIRASASYTHVVEVTGGRTVYLAGQVAIDAGGNLVGPGDLRAQAQQVFENLETALASVGGGFEHLVKTNIYVTDMADLAGLREVRSQYMADPPPTSTLVQVVQLAREGFLLEVKGIAVVPE
jgi:enamine deaminase RidA (YjgF/YER057c/UK114 family)|tara:strand:+ start:748 stop:1293 length:546 start_codon:yes stop_codon:yes gene_type:complete